MHLLLNKASLFQLHADVDSNLIIQIDSTELHQILTNLIVNARDAMQHGGNVSISLKQGTKHDLICNACIEILEGDFIELSISDTGTGIDQKVIDHIFDPFFTTKPVGEGTGLGLSTVSGMVHDAGGHIIVQSNTTEPNLATPPSPDPLNQGLPLVIVCIVFHTIDHLPRPKPNSKLTPC